MHDFTGPETPVTWTRGSHRPGRARNRTAGRRMVPLRLTPAAKSLSAAVMALMALRTFTTRKWTT